MSIGGRGGIPRFSNPRQKWPDESGVPIGTPGDEWSDRVEGPADAVRALNNIRQYVANNRASASRCAYALSPMHPMVPASGGEYRIGVTTAPGCAWMARADSDGFATVTAGGSGLGSGEVAFRVAANEGWERGVAILVAGEVYAMRQAGSRAVTPVCERLLPVSRAISKTVGKPCSEVTHSDLAAIRNLNLPWHWGTTALEPGMLGGLTSLQELRIWHPGLQVQPGAFNGLTNLKRLSIHSDLTTLPSGMFDGLTNLHHLSLFANRLTVLKTDAFRELSNLRHLDVNGNELETLEPGAFNGLSKLTYLTLAHNSLTTLMPGVFDQLPKLDSLYLFDNALTELKPGLFNWKQLSRLVTLDLRDNHLTMLAPGTFDGAILKALELQGNSLNLTPGAFNGLRVEQLHLSGNGITKLPVGALGGLFGLQMLYLHDNRLTALPAGLLRGLGDGLEYLRLGANQLRTLPLGFFDGLARLRQLELSGNPGAPFPLRLELVPAAPSDAGRGASTGVSVEVAEGAPFDIAARLSASGGELSAQEVLVSRGRTRGEVVLVLPTNDGPVTIELSPVPSVVAHPLCSEGFSFSQWVVLRSPSCYLGVRAVAGAPLVMNGFRDQTLAPEGAVRFHLPTAFPTFGGGTSYAVELSDPSAAEAVVRDGLLIVTATGGGETTLTVTATSPDGRRETRRFAVTALASPPKLVPLRSRWGGWRSALLRPPSSGGSDDS